MKKTVRIEAIQKAKAVAPFKKKIIQDDEPYIASNMSNEHSDIALACDTTAGATTPTNNDTKVSPWVWAAGGVALLAGGAAWAVNRNDSSNESGAVNHAPQSGGNRGTATTIDVPYSFFEDSFGNFQDVDGHKLKAVIIDKIVDEFGGRLTFDGKDVVAGQVILVGQLNKLVWAPNDINGSINIAIRLQDDGGTAHGGTDTSEQFIFGVSVGEAVGFQEKLINGEVDEQVDAPVPAFADEIIYEVNPISASPNASTEQIVEAKAAADVAFADEIIFQVNGPLASGASDKSSSVIGLDKLKADAAFAGMDGSGFAVAVLDTGMNLSHEYFGPDADRNGIADKIVFSKDFTTETDGSARDANGHGSHIASIAASSVGVASGANLINLQVLNANNAGDSTSIGNALQWVIDNAA